MASIIVVGNGVIKGKGKLIDSYDKVVRINHLDKPFDPKDRGIKIDIWALIGSKKNVPFFRDKYPSIKELWIFSGPYKNQPDKWLNFVRAMIGCEPTTGFFAIIRAIRDYKKADIIGFDFFQGEDLHYWNDNCSFSKATRNHDVLYESMMVDHWVRMGIVRKL